MFGENIEDADDLLIALNKQSNFDNIFEIIE